MSLWGCAAPGRLSAQASGLPAGGSTGLLVAAELLLCRVPQGIDIEVGAFPWPAGVLGARGGAGVGPAGRADTGGGSAGARTGRRAAHAAALAGLVARAVPADAAVARGLRALHAAGAHRRSPWRIARALHRSGARGRDATAGLAQPSDG